MTNIGPCQHLPNGIRERAVQYELVTGRICQKSRSTSHLDERITVPCDCTVDDLRQISGPIGMSRCQQLIFIKTDPDCAQKDYFPPYKYSAECSGIEVPPANQALFINDWNHAGAGSLNSGAIKT